MNLGEYNALRNSYNLPELNPQNLVNKDFRIPLYQTGEGAYSQKINDAEKQGWSPAEIIDYLEKEGLQDQIKEARENGKTDDEIIRFLKQGTFNNDLSMSLNGSVTIPQGLASVNNNPGNLRFIGQQGAVQGKGGFARFDTPEAGWQALVKDIQAKQSGRSVTGLNARSTLRDLVYKYAPPNENDSALYLRQIVQMLGVNPDTPIGLIPTRDLAKAIAQKESSTIIG